MSESTVAASLAGDADATVRVAGDVGTNEATTTTTTTTTGATKVHHRNFRNRAARDRKERWRQAQTANWRRGADSYSEDQSDSSHSDAVLRWKQGSSADEADEDGLALPENLKPVFVGGKLMVRKKKQPGASARSKKTYHASSSETASHSSKSVSEWERAQTADWRGGKQAVPSGLQDWDDDDDDDDDFANRLRQPLKLPSTVASSSSSSSSSGSSSSSSGSGSDSPSSSRKKAPARPKPSMLTRQDHIRHVDESDKEYYTPTDSDDTFESTDEEDASAEREDDEFDEEFDDDEIGADALKKLKKKKKRTDKRALGKTLTPPMSPKSKARHRCIKGELAASKARTEALRAQHAAVKYALEVVSETGERVVNDELSLVLAEASKESGTIDAGMRVRTSMFAKTNGLSPLPVCTCNESPMTLIGSNQKGSCAAYCQIHMPFAAAKMGVYGTSHSENHVEEATRRLRAVYLEEKAMEEKQKEKVRKSEARRKARGDFSWAKGGALERQAGDSSDSDWDIARVSKTVGGHGGPPLVVPNPHIESSKKRLAELRESHGYQLFETRTHYMIVTNNTSKSLYRLAKIERFSDEFRIDEDPFLYSQMQIQNLLKMAAMSQQGCRRISGGHGIVGFIQLYNFESTSETGLDLDAMNDCKGGDIIKITEQIYRKHIWAMKRKELMFSFLERTKTVRGIPSYLYQLGPHQGYTLFSGADQVRPIGKFGVKTHTRAVPPGALSAAAKQIASGPNATAVTPTDVDGQVETEVEPTKVQGQANWFDRIVANIDEAVQNKEEELRRRDMKKMTKDQNDEIVEQQRREQLKREEEAAAALAASEENWTKMILEGFIVPEIPTDNALPGQVMQIAANKYIYRTKYLTVFRELDPSEDDESDPDDAALREEDMGESSSDSERAKSDKKRSDQQPSSPTKTSASSRRFDRFKSMFQSKKHPPPEIEKQVSFHTPGDEDILAERADMLPSKMSKQLSKDLREADAAKSNRLQASRTMTRIRTTRADGAEDVLSPKSPKSPKPPGIKSQQTMAKENAVVINSKTYPEDKVVFQSDSDPDWDSDGDDYVYSDESSDTDDDEEVFVEYTLIERILIFLGFLEDRQAKKKAAHESSDSEEEPTAGIFTRVYGGVGALMKQASLKTKAPGAKKTKPGQRKNADGVYRKKKESAPKKRRLTKEELAAAVERRRVALEARENRRKHRAEIRAARAKAQAKAQARIDRYKFEPNQDIVKLRFKAFGGHAPMML